MTSRVQSQVPPKNPQNPSHEGGRAMCACGCGESFTPIKRTQKYIEDHRFRGYTSHACPSCGIIHRKAANK